MSIEIRVPPLGESIVEATVGKWLKQPGDQVNAGETLVELETDKVNVEVNAEHAGVLEQISKREGENVGIGEVLGVLAGQAAHTQPRADGKPTEAQPREATPQQQAEPNGTTKSAGDTRPVTPVARKVAQEQGVDLNTIAGSGAGGRVTKDDVVTQRSSSNAGHIPQTTAAKQPSISAPPTAPTQPAASAAQEEGRREERMRMSRRRQTIANRLVEAQHTAAMLTTFNEIDMSAVIEIRKRRKESFRERHGVGLGFMSFFTKAAIGALKAFPMLNAEIQRDEIVVKHYYDIGIAVGVEEGLVVPVLRNADRMSFAAIEQKIGDLAKRAHEGKLTLAELQGGTFTITNGGVFGSLMSTPILNSPQVGILGMHKIEERPIALNGQVVIRPMMYIALSYDHRIIDGSTAVRFVVRIKELIEDPEALLLEG